MKTSFWPFYCTLQSIRSSLHSSLVPIGYSIPSLHSIWLSSSSSHSPSTIIHHQYFSPSILLPLHLHRSIRHLEQQLLQWKHPTASDETLHRATMRRIIPLWLREDNDMHILVIFTCLNARGKDKEKGIRRNINPSSSFSCLTMYFWWRYMAGDNIHLSLQSPPPHISPTTFLSYSLPQSLSLIDRKITDKSLVRVHKLKVRTTNGREGGGIQRKRDKKETMGNGEAWERQVELSLCSLSIHQEWTVTSLTHEKREESTWLTGVKIDIIMR